MASPDEEWDRFKIRAEVHRRGSTLTEIAQQAGIAESSCRMALVGASRAGAEALSAFLGVPLPTLFPGLYLRARPNQRKPSPKNPASSRQKRKAAPASERASA